MPTASGPREGAGTPLGEVAGLCPDRAERALRLRLGACVLLPMGSQDRSRGMPPTRGLGDSPIPSLLPALRKESFAFQRGGTTGNCIVNPRAEALGSPGLCYSQ